MALLQNRANYSINISHVVLLSGINLDNTHYGYYQEPFLIITKIRWLSGTVPDNHKFGKTARCGLWAPDGSPTSWHVCYARERPVSWLKRIAHERNRSWRLPFVSFPASCNANRTTQCTWSRRNRDKWFRSFAVWITSALDGHFIFIFDTIKDFISNSF